MASITLFYGRDGEPIDEGDSDALVAAWKPESRRVAVTDIGESSVSTVHLVLDHSHGFGPPLIFETMVFGGEHDQWQDRYSTEAEAQAGHEAVVAWLKGEGPEPRL